MLSLKVKEKKDYYIVGVKGKNCDVIQGIAVLDGLITYLKKEYNLSIKDILEMLKEFKEETRHDDGF